MRKKRGNNGKDGEMKREGYKRNIIINDIHFTFYYIHLDFVFANNNSFHITEGIMSNLLSDIIS
jgi:hypothetical protein